MSSDSKVPRSGKHSRPEDVAAMNAEWQAFQAASSQEDGAGAGGTSTGGAGVFQDEDLQALEASIAAEEIRNYEATLGHPEGTVRVRKKRRHSSKTKQNKRKTALVAVATVVGVLVLIAAALGIYVAVLQGRMGVGGDAGSRLRAALSSQTSKDAPYYVLLLGTDDAAASEGTSRSDSMVLARVDPKDTVVTLVSIPRDTMVELPGYGRSKINAAYAYDGPAGAVEAVNRFAGVSISHYVQVDFSGLVSVVDKLGGVWVDVPRSNDENGERSAGSLIAAGGQLMDGKTALSFARERYGYAEGDFQRAQNQRLVIQAIIKGALSSSPTELPGVVSSLADSVVTDYSLSDVIELAMRFKNADGVTIYSAQVPSSTLDLDGVSYVTTDHAAWSVMMRKIEAGTDPNGNPNGS